MKFAINVIMGAGFGVPFTWEEKTDDIWPGHELSFREAVSTLMHYIYVPLFVPKMLLKLPIKVLQKVRQADNEFSNYLRDLLEREKKLGKDSNGKNLTSALIKHAVSEQGGSELGVLHDEELMGNAFIFLLAGHETTYHSPEINIDCSAHTIMYAFTMLALHPEIQEKLFSEIRQVFGDRIPRYDDFQNLVYPLCVMMETLRFFPPAIEIPKSTLNGEKTLLGKYWIPKDPSA